VATSSCGAVLSLPLLHTPPSFPLCECARSAAPIDRSRGRMQPPSLHRECHLPVAAPLQQQGSLAPGVASSSLQEPFPPPAALPYHAPVPKCPGKRPFHDRSNLKWSPHPAVASSRARRRRAQPPPLTRPLTFCLPAAGGALTCWLSIGSAPSDARRQRHPPWSRRRPLLMRPPVCRRERARRRGVSPRQGACAPWLLGER
jgi:hypothetical protein